MSWMDVASLGIFGACLVLPLTGVVLGVRRYQRRRRAYMVDLGERGSVHATEISLFVGIIILAGGAVLAGAAGIPMLVWIVDGDPEARRVVLVMAFIVGPSFALLGFLTALPSFRYYVVEPERLTRIRFRRERHLLFSDISTVERSQALTGGVRFTGPAGSMRVSGQVNAYDELVDRIMSATAVSAHPVQENSADPARPIGERREFSVSSRRTTATLTFLAALLVFFMAWPWFLVEGDHPVRDSFAFMGIGFVLWAIVALLVSQESFQRDQPAELRLHDGGLEYRQFRKGWVSRSRDEFFVATVVTNIIYVKGMPGKRYPLVVGFSDGTGFRIDDMRASHMKTTTHQLAAELRHRYSDPAAVGLVQRETGAQHAAAATEAAAAGDRDRQIAELRHAISHDPALAPRLRDLGDLLRQSGRHEDAVLVYNAHLDFSPDDHRAYEGLIASLRAQGRDDLAAEAADAAERILLNG